MLSMRSKFYNLTIVPLEADVRDLKKKKKNSEKTTNPRQLFDRIVQIETDKKLYFNLTQFEILRLHIIKAMYYEATNQLDKAYHIYQMLQKNYPKYWYGYSYALDFLYQQGLNAGEIQNQYFQSCLDLIDKMKTQFNETPYSPTPNHWHHVFKIKRKIRKQLEENDQGIDISLNNLFALSMEDDSLDKEMLAEKEDHPIDEKQKSTKGFGFLSIGGVFTSLSQYFTQPKPAYIIKPSSPSKRT